MYKITYIHKDSNIENILFDPGGIDTEQYTLTDATLSLGCGLSGELTLGIPESNPAKNDLACLTDEVIFYRNGEEIWRGRPVTWQEDFDLTGTLTCEGILSYLYDSYFPPFEFAGSPKELLEDIIESHNAQVEEQKRFTLGEVTVVDANDYISRSSTEYNRSLEVLMDKLTGSSLGGYLRVRIEGGVRYLDYLESYGTTATQPIQLGVNLIDIADTIEYGDLITALLPLGARDEETQEYLTVASVNGGSIYIYDEQAVSQYGWICGSAVWEDVTLPENLLKKAQDYLTQATAGVRSMTINAIDLTLAGEDVDAINLGDSVLVQSAPHGVNQYIELVEMTLHPLDPASDTLTLGAMSASYTGTASTSQRKVQDSIDQTSTYIRNLSAEFVTTEYLAANYATFGYVDAAIINAGFITVDYLEANYASIEYLETYYATIDALEATVANITALTSDVANITSLLSGEVGTGSLQSIVLTTDNAVIDEALIYNIIAANANIGSLLAGIIYTDYITIMSENGGIVIAGTTIQISDEDGTVRMQIGQDADGNFTFIIYDETGTGIMIDSEGIHESAVPDGLIVDSMVSDDAAIQGSKLDIASVAECLTADGTLIVQGSQVTINGETLDTWYAEIERQLEGLEGLTFDGLVNLTEYFALGDSYEDPPLDPDGTVTPAQVGTAIVGTSLVDVTQWSDVWSTDRKVAGEGQYLWVVWLAEYNDGSYAWSTPVCLTDGYSREHMTVLQTELSVVQGQIAAKVWQTDIDTAYTALYGDITTLTDQYAAISISLGDIEISVGNLETVEADHYLEMSTQIANISVTLDAIDLSLSSINQSISGLETSAITDSKTEYYLSTSSSELTGGTWSEDYPGWTDGTYIWVRTTITMGTGDSRTTTTTDPICLTGNSGRDGTDGTNGTDGVGVANITAYYSVSGSATWCQPHGDDGRLAIVGSAVVGTAVADNTGVWTTEMPTVDITEYLWACLLVEYTNGETAWTDAWCLTDDSTRTVVSQISEQFADVLIRLDGIDLYVYSLETTVMEDYTELSERYAAISITLDGITETVSALDETVTGDILILTERVAGIEINVDSVTTRVSSVESEVASVSNAAAQAEAAAQAAELLASGAIVKATPYFAESGSPDWYPSHTDDGTLALVGSAIVGNAKADNSGTWTLKQPAGGEGIYIWCAYLYEYADGTEEWQEPFWIDDGSVKAELGQMREQYAQLVLEVDSAVLEVVSIQNDLAGNYSTTSEMRAAIEEAVDEESASIMSQVSGTYATQGSLTTMENTIYQYVDSSISSISLSVSGSLGGSASIVMTAGGKESSGSIDMSKVREAFANDKSAITISAGTITFNSNLLVVNSSQFSLDANGNATFSGTLNAASGTFAGTLSAVTGTFSSIYTGYHSSYDSNSTGVWAGSTGLSVGYYFKVSNTGVVTATNGNFSGTITTESGDYRTEMSAGRLYTYYNDELYGRLMPIYSSGEPKYYSLLADSDSDVSISLGIGATGYIFVNGGNNPNGYSERVQLSGGCRIRSCYVNMNSAYSIRWDSGNDTDILARVYGNSSGLWLYGDAGNVYLNGSPYNSSDKKLKKDIEPMSVSGSKDLLEEIDELEPVEFEWAGKRSDGKIHYGYIANQVQEVMPELVSEEEDDGTLYLAYTEIIPLLHLKIKQLEDRLAKLEANG